MPQRFANPRFARRRFLGGLGLGVVAAPFVPLLNASGRERTFPRRLVLFFTPHGTIWDAWKPTGAGTKFTLGPILAPLERHKRRLNVIAGLEVLQPGPGAPHTKGPPLLWTASPLLDDKTFVRADGSGGLYFGWNSGPSIDQVIARSLADRPGHATPYRSIELGVRSGASHPGSRMIYTGPRQPLPPESNPVALMDRLFGTADAGYEAMLARRRSAIDVLKADLDAFAAETGADDRAKLEQHLEAVRGIETRLTEKPVACRRAPRANGRAAIDPNLVDNAPVVLGAQLDILTAALSCDITRIASVQYRVGENDNDRYSWLGLEDGHHSMSHAGDSDTVTRGHLTRIYTWYATQFAALLDRLASVREGSGTLLDNTLVVWGSELGKGNSHAFSPVPFVTAGACGGVIETGRFLDLKTRTPHNRLLVSMAHAMGATDLQRFGSTDPGQGPLAELTG